jgi:hypothetical protein
MVRGSPQRSPRTVRPVGRGVSALSAVIDALEPFDGYVDDLIRSAPRELFQ